MIDITPLEKSVMDSLLDDTREPFVTLSRQYGVASITERQPTGKGFFLFFSIPENVDRIDRNLSIKFGDVVAAIKGLDYGAGFILHVNNGAIDFLEGYSYDEPWPNCISEFTLSKDEGLTKKRDEAVKRFYE